MCDFEIEIDTDSAKLVERLKGAVARYGGEFSGNTETGSWKLSTPVKFWGSYRFEKQKMCIDIDKKPLWISCGQIKKGLEAKLNNTPSPIIRRVQQTLIKLGLSPSQ